MPEVKIILSLFASRIDSFISTLTTIFSPVNVAIDRLLLARSIVPFKPDNVIFWNNSSLRTISFTIITLLENPEACESPPPIIQKWGIIIPVTPIIDIPNVGLGCTNALPETLESNILLIYIFSVTLRLDTLRFCKEASVPFFETPSKEP